MTLRTRRPTGLPSWPIALLAGMQGTGKTRSAAEASASPLIAQTYWISFGELDPDEFSTLPGVDFDIVDHDGSVRDVVQQVEEMASQPASDLGATLIVLDSGSKIWSTIGEEVRQAKSSRVGDDSNSDLWTDAKGDWQALLNALRRHHGPSIITARLDELVVHDDGKPTSNRNYRVKAEKDLAYDVDVMIEMRSRGEYALTKTNSVALGFVEARREWPAFTFDQLWRQMGLEAGAGERAYTVPQPKVVDSVDRSGRNWMAELAAANTVEQIARLGVDANAMKADRTVMSAIRTKHRAINAPVGTAPPGR